MCLPALRLLDGRVSSNALRHRVRYEERLDRFVLEGAGNRRAVWKFGLAVTGCFVVGLFLALAIDRSTLDPRWRLFGRRLLTNNVPHGKTVPQVLATRDGARTLATGVSA